MKAHSEKFRFIILGKTGLHALQIGDITKKSVSSVTLLGTTIDLRFNLKEDINDIIKEAC